MLRAANPEDLARIHALLSAADLSTTGVSGYLDRFFVFEADGAVEGVGGLEPHGASALLRSLAVAPGQRGRGVGSALCDRLEAEAARRGVTHIYLLTETARRFFLNRGYVSLDRSDAPPEIASSDQFARLCPVSAALMCRAVRQCSAAEAETAARFPGG